MNRTALAVLFGVLGLSALVVLAQGSGPIDYQQADAEPPPTTQPFVRPVRVVNFPDPQSVVGSVAIDNLPEVQTVDGEISVSNLPAVHTVEGDVSVANFPLVQEVVGEVSVSNIGELALGPQFQVLQVPAFIEACLPTTSRYVSAPFDVGGWNGFTVYLQLMEPESIAPEGWFVRYRHFAADSFPEPGGAVNAGLNAVLGVEAVLVTGCRNNDAEYPLPPSHFSVYLTR